MEKLNYTILSIDDSREVKKKEIRRIIGEAIPEIFVVCVNGRKKNQARAWYNQSPGVNPVWGNPHQGEIGIWLSQINCWRKIVKTQTPLLIFEDDAVLAEDFLERLEEMIRETPDPYDFISVFVPNNQERDFYSEVFFDSEGKPEPFSLGAPEGAPCYYAGSTIMAKVYQGYSCVATLISVRGAERLLHLCERFGMYTPVDCFFFLNAHRGLLEGYAPRPDYPRAVSIVWEDPTTIHNTELFDIMEKKWES